MRRLMKYTAAAAMVAASPLLAQESAPPVPEPGEAMGGAAADAMPGGAEMSPEQMRTYGLWPDDRRALFDAWPAEAKGYFWTLTPPRQEVFWMLGDGDRATLTAMNGPDQEQTWQRLEQQMLASQPPVGAQPPAAPEASAPPMPPAPAPDAPDEATAGTEDIDEVDDHSPR